MLPAEPELTASVNIVRAKLDMRATEGKGGRQKERMIEKRGEERKRWREIVLKVLSGGQKNRKGQMNKYC